MITLLGAVEIAHISMCMLKFEAMGIDPILLERPVREDGTPSGSQEYFDIQGVLTPRER